MVRWRKSETWADETKKGGRKKEIWNDERKDEERDKDGEMKDGGRNEYEDMKRRCRMRKIC